MGFGEAIPHPLIRGEIAPPEPSTAQRLGVASRNPSPPPYMFYAGKCGLRMLGSEGILRDYDNRVLIGADNV